MDRKVILAAVVLVVGAGALAAVIGGVAPGDADSGPETDSDPDDGTTESDLQTFGSAEEFEAYSEL